MNKPKKGSLVKCVRKTITEGSGAIHAMTNIRSGFYDEIFLKNKRWYLCLGTIKHKELFKQKFHWDKGNPDYEWVIVLSENGPCVIHSDFVEQVMG